MTRHIWEGDEPLLSVHHDDDGDWIFSGMTAAGDVVDDDLFLVHLAHVVERFPEVATLAYLPRDQHVDRRSPEQPFVIAPD